MKKLVYTICLVVIGMSLSAQDLHLTQFEEAQLRMNPALTEMSLEMAIIIVFLIDIVLNGARFQPSHLQPSIWDTTQISKRDGALVRTS